VNELKYDKFLKASRTLINPEYRNGYHLGLMRFFKNISQPIDKLSRAEWSKDYQEGFKDGSKGKSPKGIDGRIGNFNQKGVNANTRVILRINSDLKTEFKAKAKAEGVSLSEWITEACVEKLKNT